MSLQTDTLTAEVLSNLGRDGRIESSDRSLNFDLSAKGAPTPEHFFAAAYAACFHSALRSAAKTAHLDITGSTVIARVTLGEDDKGDSRLEVELRAAIPGVGADRAGRLLHQAHQTCPYSRAVRGNVDVRLRTD